MRIDCHRQIAVTALVALAACARELVEPSEISEVRVLLTLLEGEPVHGDLSLAL
jgi:hypothetical protein